MAGQAPRPGWAAVDQAAVALVDEAGARGHLVRLVGSTGIRLHCPPAAAALDRLGRPAKDIDVVCRHEDRKGLRRLLEERGWEVDRDLLVAMEGRRYAFRHPASGLEHTFTDHVAGPVPPLLTGLEHKDHITVELVTLCGEQPSGADEHCHVRVVPAGVHCAVDFARIGNAGRLFHR